MIVPRLASLLQTLGSSQRGREGGGYLLGVSPLPHSIPGLSIINVQMSWSSPWYAVCTWHRLSTNMTHKTVLIPPAPASKVLMVTFKYSSSWCNFLRLIINNVQVAASVFAIFGNLTWLQVLLCDFRFYLNDTGMGMFTLSMTVWPITLTIKHVASKYTELGLKVIPAARQPQGYETSLSVVV